MASMVASVVASVVALEDSARESSSSSSLGRLKVAPLSSPTTDRLGLRETLSNPLYPSHLHLHLHQDLWLSWHVELRLCLEILPKILLCPLERLAGDAQPRRLCTGRGLQVWNAFTVTRGTSRRQCSEAILTVKGVSRRIPWPRAPSRFLTVKGVNPKNTLAKSKAMLSMCLKSF